MLAAALVGVAWCALAAGEDAPGCCALQSSDANPCTLLPGFQQAAPLGESVACCRGPATSNCTGRSTGGPFVYSGTITFDGVNYDCGHLPQCPRPTEAPVPSGVPFPHAGTGCTIPADTECPVSRLSPRASKSTLGDTSACCYAETSSATCSLINGVVSGSYTCGGTTVPCAKIPSCSSAVTPTVSPGSPTPFPTTGAAAGLAPAVLAVLSAAALVLL